VQEIERGDLLYANPLAAEGDLAGFRLEGEAVLSFPAGRLRMQNALDPALGQRSNFVLWCPEEFPPDVAISWEFHPIAEPGLCMFFFATRGRRGEDLFDPALAPRHGIYDQYHHGDLDGYHVSYFRRRVPEGRAFHVCNLRKSYGFHLAAQGPDPLPGVADAAPPYHLRVDHVGAEVRFSINDLPILRFVDDGARYGPLLGGGKIGFRQMAPLVGEYANLSVHRARYLR